MKFKLGQYPSLVYRLKKCEEAISSKAQIWVKREDLCAEFYGGNKVRKLEYILKGAIQKGAKTVFSIGALGSNHVLATSIYAKELKLHNVGFLVPQPYQGYVKKNILASLGLGADLVYLSYVRMFFAPFIFLYYYLKFWLKDGARPYLIWFGGSSSIGCLGAFDMGQELVDQIKSGDMPRPDKIFVPVGTCGTMSGVVLAMKMFDPEIEVIGVTVFGAIGANRKSVCALVNQLIHDKNLDFPKVQTSEIKLVTEFLGKGYAHFTKEGNEALELVQKSEGLHLDGTYTAKAMACLLSMARAPSSKGKIFLFINTYNSKDMSLYVQKSLKSKIPRNIKKYLEDSEPHNCQSYKL